MAQNNKCHCLICNGYTEDTVSRDASVEDGASLSALIYDELHVIFVLRNILEVPKDKLEGYLKTLGNPTEWKVAFCGSCRGAIENAKRIYQEILESTKIYKAVKREIVEMVKKTGGRSASSSASTTRVTAECREFVCGGYRNCDSGTDPYVLGDSMARDALATSSSTVKLGNLTSTFIKAEPILDLEASSTVQAPPMDDPFFLELPVEIKTEFSFDNLEADSSFEPPPSQSSNDSDFEPDSLHRRSKGKKAPYRKRKATFGNDKTITKIPYTHKKGRAAPLSLLGTKNAPPSVQHAFDKVTEQGHWCRCGKKYEHAHHLLRHVREKCGGKLQELYPCEICKIGGIEKAYKRRDDLRRHVEFVHQKFRYTCPTCGGSYSRLDKHFFDHPDHKPDAQVKKTDAISN